MLANTWRLTGEQRRLIRERVISEKRHVVFQGVLGYTDGTRLSIDYSREATGIADLKLAGDGNCSPRFVAGEETARIIRRGNTWFATDPVNSTDEWRRIFQAAGSRIYVDTGDIIHAGGGLVLVHTKAGGRMTLKLRNRAPIALELAAKTSALFDAGSGERLL